MAFTLALIQIGRKSGLWGALKTRAIMRANLYRYEQSKYLISRAPSVFWALVRTSKCANETYELLCLSVSESFQVRIYGSASSALGFSGWGDFNGMHLPEQLTQRDSGVCRHAGSDLRQHTQATLWSSDGRTESLLSEQWLPFSSGQNAFLYSYIKTVSSVQTFCVLWDFQQPN